MKRSEEDMFRLRNHTAKVETDCEKYRVQAHQVREFRSRA